MEVSYVLALVLGVTLAALTWLVLMVQRLRRDLAKERSSKRSLSTRYGLLTEQFIPFAESYPWDPASFRFLGAPIDGIQFEEDRIILVEFKAGEGHLSAGQRKIRDLVRAHKVDFELIRIR